MSGYNIGIGVGLRYIQRGVVDLMAQTIRSSMVVWYDIKRQGATNESMSQNPILKDLSGHGHDATCYNFAWMGMSGIGGYPVGDFTANGVVPNGGAWRPICSVKNYTKQPFKVLINCKGHEGEHVDIIVSHRDNDTGDLHYRVINNDVIIGQVCTVPVLEVNNDERHLYFNMNRYIGEEVSIQAIPEYPNALVADGVDDYVKVEGTPILADYTVIAKRKRLDADLAKRGALASKMPSYTDDGAFLFEYIQQDTGIKQVVSFGTFTRIQMVDTDISYMTKNSYNGTSIKSGQEQDTSHLTLFSTREHSGCAQAALYSFILFDRTLTDEEIEWVKKNLLGVETPEQKYSCFGTGQWVMKYPWINDDLWKMKK